MCATLWSDSKGTKVWFFIWLYHFSTVPFRINGKTKGVIIIAAFIKYISD